jgi:hypothetical protein
MQEVSSCATTICAAPSVNPMPHRPPSGNPINSTPEALAGKPFVAASKITERWVRMMDTPLPIRLDRASPRTPFEALACEQHLWSRPFPIHDAHLPAVDLLEKGWPNRP